MESAAQAALTGTLIAGCGTQAGHEGPNALMEPPVLCKPVEAFGERSLIASSQARCERIHSLMCKFATTLYGIALQ